LSVQCYPHVSNLYSVRKQPSSVMLRMLVLCSLFITSRSTTLTVFSACIGVLSVSGFAVQGAGRQGSACALLTVPGFTHPVEDLYLGDVLEMTGYAIGRNSKCALQQPPPIKLRLSAVLPQTSDLLFTHLGNACVEYCRIHGTTSVHAGEPNVGCGGGSMLRGALPEPRLNALLCAGGPRKASLTMKAQHPMLTPMARLRMLPVMCLPHGRMHQRCQHQHPGH
jgi:hypothetical protein